MNECRTLWKQRLELSEQEGEKDYLIRLTQIQYIMRTRWPKVWTWVCVQAKKGWQRFANRKPLRHCCTARLESRSRSRQKNCTTGSTGTPEQHGCVHKNLWEECLCDVCVWDPKKKQRSTWKNKLLKLHFCALESGWAGNFSPEIRADKQRFIFYFDNMHTDMHTVVS